MFSQPGEGVEPPSATSSMRGGVQPSSRRGTTLLSGDAFEDLLQVELQQHPAEQPQQVHTAYATYSGMDLQGVVTTQSPANSPMVRARSDLKEIAKHLHVPSEGSHTHQQLHSHGSTLQASTSSNFVNSFTVEMPPHSSTQPDDAVAGRGNLAQQTVVLGDDSRQQSAGKHQTLLEDADPEEKKRRAMLSEQKLLAQFNNNLLAPFFDAGGHAQAPASTSGT